MIDDETIDSAVLDDDEDEGVDLDALETEADEETAAAAEKEEEEAEESDVDKALKLLREKNPNALREDKPSAEQGEPKYATYEDAIAGRTMAMQDLRDEIIEEVEDTVKGLPAETIRELKNALKQPGMTLDALKGIKASKSAVQHAKGVAYDLQQSGKLKPAAPVRKANTPAPKGNEAPRTVVKRDPERQAQLEKMASRLGVSVDDLAESEYIKGKKK